MPEGDIYYIYKRGIIALERRVKTGTISVVLAHARNMSDKEKIAMRVKGYRKNKTLITDMSIEEFLEAYKYN